MLVVIDIIMRVLIKKFIYQMPINRGRMIITQCARTRVRLSTSLGSIGTMRAASAPFFRHSATATIPIAVVVFPCVTEKRERSRVLRIAGIGAAYSRCRL